MKLFHPTSSLSITSAIALFGTTTTITTTVEACSRVFQNKYDTMVSGRSMDWAHSFDDILQINPRGAGMTGGQNMDNPATWTSKYGSVTSSIVPYFYNISSQCQESFEYYQDGSADGINEKGLAAHVLYLGEEDGTVYAEPSNSTDLPNIQYMRWVRYVLDNFATVEEAVQGMKSVNTVRGYFCPGYVEKDDEGRELGAHMAIEDKTGDSAIFEHVGGELQVYHSKQDALVMTNEPPFNEHQEILSQYEPWGGNIALPENLPGSVGSSDRYVRLEYYLMHTPEPQTHAEAIANVISMISSTNVPFGAPYMGGVYPTWWESAADVTNNEYYFNWLTTPNVIWLELDDVDFDNLDSDTYYKLEPQNPDFVGNVMCDMTDDDGNVMPGCDDVDESSSATGLLTTTKYMLSTTIATVAFSFIFAL